MSLLQLSILYSDCGYVVFTFWLGNLTWILLDLLVSGKSKKVMQPGVSWKAILKIVKKMKTPLLRLLCFKVITQADKQINYCSEWWDDNVWITLISSKTHKMNKDLTSDKDACVSKQHKYVVR